MNPKRPRAVATEDATRARDAAVRGGGKAGGRGTLGSWGLGEGHPQQDVLCWGPGLPAAWLATKRQWRPTRGRPHSSGSEGRHVVIPGDEGNGRRMSCQTTPPPRKPIPERNF